eukprot:GDKJ01028662.1.p2 GENE.GDKJ01028662.1~~GDKJ01028662.1.p2  ORF type:complete len:244 (+),score=12.59 GDKJ01028662.1:504-1235(+)
MKKILFLLLMVIAASAYSQGTDLKPSSTKLDENTIVKDADGNVVTYKLWQALMQTGDYALRRPSGATAFLIYKMSEAEKAVAKERKAKTMVNLPRPALSGAFTDGEKFKGERITDINGNKYDLKVDKDKIYVINFWFINCPPCKAEIPELNELVTKYKENKDVVFLAIALDEKFELKNFLKTMPFTYNIVDGKYYAQKYGVKSFPTHVVVGKDGLIKFNTMGLASNTVYWIDKTIKEQLALVN